MSFYAILTFLLCLKEVFILSNVIEVESHFGDCHQYLCYEDCVRTVPGNAEATIGIQAAHEYSGLHVFTEPPL